MYRRSGPRCGYRHRGARPPQLRADPEERLVEVLVDVVTESLERRDVEDPGLVRQRSATARRVGQTQRTSSSIPQRKAARSCRNRSAPRSACGGRSESPASRAPPGRKGPQGSGARTRCERRDGSRGASWGHQISAPHDAAATVWLSHRLRAPGLLGAGRRSEGRLLSLELLFRKLDVAHGLGDRDLAGRDVGSRRAGGGR